MADETTRPPGWSNAPADGGISTTEPAPGTRNMREPGWSNDAVAPVDPLALSLTALQPATAVLGDPSFTLHVQGAGFVDGAVIVFGGQDEPTTFVSPTEVTTGVDMTVWVGADPAVPVTVRNPDSATSNALPFAFTDPGR